MPGDELLSRSVDALPPIAIDQTRETDGGGLDLWLYFYERDTPERLVGETALLAETERPRYESFQFDRDRRQYLAARALLRRSLSCYAPVPPAEWRFANDERGKPRIVHPRERPSLNFNLTHTAGLAACVVSAAYARVGVDAERIRGDLDVLAVARECLSTDEARTLDRMPAASLGRRFLAYWTLKESFLKGCGRGLGVGLDACSFELDEEPIRVRVPLGLDEDPARWSFAVLHASPDHVVAVAAETARTPWSIRAARVPPWPGFGAG